MLAPARTLGQDRRAPAGGDERVRGPLLAGTFLLVVAAQIAFAPFSQFPFSDAKFPLVLAGTALLWTMRPSVASSLAIAAGAWFGVSVLATAFGVDPWWSLLGAEDQGNGLILVAVCAALAPLGAGLPAALVKRLPAWLAATGVAVAIVGIAGRLAPSAVAVVVPDLRLDGSTLGHPVFLAVLMAAALGAVVAIAARRPALALAAAALLASGLTLSGKRGGWLAAGVALAITLRGHRPPRRVTLGLCATVVAVMAVWTAADMVLLPKEPLTAGRRFDELTDASAQARPYVLATSARAFAERPLLGWGPANLWGANLSSASAGEMRVTGRVWHDAHNIVAETAVTAGLFGAASLTALLVVLAYGAVRSPPGAAWAAGAAAALLVHHFLQPLHVSLTPLMFLLAGIAAGPGLARSSRTPSRRPSRPVLVLGLVVLVAGGVLAGLRFAASTFEMQGRKYLSQPALRTALRLEPLRISAASKLALDRALDARADAGAGPDASAIAKRMVEQHPWDGDVRLVAADVEILRERFEAAKVWIREQLQIFPNDPWALAGIAWLERRTGNDAAAEAWIAKALAIDPCGPASRLRSPAPRCPAGEAPESHRR